MSRSTIVHASRDDGGEYPAESQYILCDPHERYGDPKSSNSDECVTCKRCLRILKEKP